MQKIIVFIITCFWTVSCVIAQNDSIIIDKFNYYFYKPDQISLESNEFDRLRNSIAFFKENSTLLDIFQNGPSLRLKQGLKILQKDMQSMTFFDNKS